MKKNMSNVDRAIRVIIALAIIGLYFADVINGTVAIVLLAVSGIFVITSLISSCPLYSIFGISTCKVKVAK